MKKNAPARKNYGQVKNREKNAPAREKLWPGEGGSELELQTIPSTFVLAEINEISRRIIWEGSQSLKRSRNTNFL